MARHFTKDEVEELRKILAFLATKDSELPSAESLDDDAILAVTVGGVSLSITVAQLREAVAMDVDDMPTEDSDNLVKSGGVFDADEGMRTDIASLETDIASLETAVSTLEGGLQDVRDELGGKQDALSFDSIPTEDSNNPVTSGGIFNANEFLSDRIGDLVDVISGKYVKPTGGIPKSDLSSGVQTSLGKADTALQEHQSLADYATKLALNAGLATKQNTLVGSGKGQNIKTIGGQSLLGTGDIVASADLLYYGSLFTDGEVDLNEVEDFTIGGVTYDYGAEWVADEDSCKVGRVISQIGSLISPEEGYPYYLIERFLIKFADSMDGVVVLESLPKGALVTSISSASTDTEYPSAKCVYDLVGDVETLLAAI